MWCNSARVWYSRCRMDNLGVIGNYLVRGLTPHRQDRRKLSVWSCSSLILNRTSSIIGPQLRKQGEQSSKGSCDV